VSDESQDPRIFPAGADIQPYADGTPFTVNGLPVEARKQMNKRALATWDAGYMCARQHDGKSPEPPAIEQAPGRTPVKPHSRRRGRSRRGGDEIGNQIVGHNGNWHWPVTDRKANPAPPDREEKPKGKRKPKCESPRTKQTSTSPTTGAKRRKKSPPGEESPSKP
jgi:hypothetical protein